MEREMTRVTRSSERGYSLVEVLVVVAVVGAIASFALLALFSMSKAHGTVVPSAERITVRSRIAAELETTHDGAAKLAYFDALGTLRRVLASTSSKSTGAVATNGDPGGKGSTGGDGGDGRPPTGGDGDDDGRPPGGGGGGGGGNGVPFGTTSVEGIFGWGSGVLVGSTRVHGAVAVWETPVAEGQVGPAVISIRTAGGVPNFALSEPFVSASRRLRLTARSAADEARIRDLRDGDLLYVNGRTSEAGLATAVALVTAAPRQLPQSTVATSSGMPASLFFEVEIAAPSTPNDWGLANTPETAGGVTFARDAVVALLDRRAPVVSYYTVRHIGTNENPKARTIALYRAIGNPAAPASVERVDDVGAALTATLGYEAVAADAPDPTDQQVLTVGLPLVGQAERANPDLIRSVLTLPARPTAMSLTLIPIDGGAR